MFNVWHWLLKNINNNILLKYLKDILTLKLKSSLIWVPLCPITSCINVSTYNLSRHLVSIISPLLQEKYSVKNSTAFNQRIKDQHISEDEVMISFDVVSLCTSIPVDLALQVIKESLHQDVNFSHCSNISMTNRMDLFEFVLSNSFFTNKGHHYKQIFVCIMGSPFKATIANLVMEHVEETAISNSLHCPNWWFRYVDGSHACLQEQYVQEFDDTHKALNPCIQFTIEIDENDRLSFLDMLTTRKNRCVEVEVTDKCPDFRFHYPTQHKQSVGNTLLDRADKVPSTNAGKHRELKQVFKV